MALSKRNSRAIEVDGTEYRWAVSGDSGFVTLVVQAAAGSGSKLEVNIAEIRQGRPEAFHEAYGLVADSPSGSKLSVTPQGVERIIGEAIEIGWNPTENGAPAEMTLAAEGLEVRRGVPGA